MLLLPYENAADKMKNQSSGAELIQYSISAPFSINRQKS